MNFVVIDVAAFFIRHQAQPPQQQVNLGFEYIGVDNPSQMTRDELSDVDLMDRLQWILPSHTFLSACQVASNPPPAASFCSEYKSFSNL